MYVLKPDQELLQKLAFNQSVLALFLRNSRFKFLSITAVHIIVGNMTFDQHMIISAAPYPIFYTTGAEVKISIPANAATVMLVEYRTTAIVAPDDFWLLRWTTIRKSSHFKVLIDELRSPFVSGRSTSISSTGKEVECWEGVDFSNSVPDNSLRM